MQAKKEIQEIDLKPYEPFGVPLLKFLFGLTVLSLVLTAAYELFF